MTRHPQKAGTHGFIGRLAALLLFLALPALAHHSNTPFDMSKTFHATGVVVKANFRNPHSLLTLQSGEPGAEAVEYEGHSLATLRHYGLSPSMVKAGDRITISYAPRRDGKPGGIFLSISTASGESLDFSKLGYD